MSKIAVLWTLHLAPIEFSGIVFISLPSSFLQVEPLRMIGGFLGYFSVAEEK